MQRPALPARRVVVDMAARMEQERRAGEAMVRMHDTLIAEGWGWDGMDGYTAPSTMTPEEVKRMISEDAERLIQEKTEGRG